MQNAPEGGRAVFASTAPAIDSIAEVIGSFAGAAFKSSASGAAARHGFRSEGIVMKANLGICGRLRLILLGASCVGIAAAIGCGGEGANVPETGADPSAATEGSGTTPLAPSQGTADAGSHDAQSGSAMQDASGASPAASDASDSNDASAPPADAGACGSGCKLAFVTRGMFTGDLKGNAGADAKCRAAAGASSYADVKSRASKFIAWVASGAPGSPGPGSRLAKAEYRRADGVLVARSLDALVGGDLMAPINVTEYGDSVGAGEAAWTGTTGNGATSAFTCNGWSSAFLTAAGNVGAPHDTGTTWTVGLPVTCSSDLRLYCVESGN